MPASFFVSSTMKRSLTLAALALCAVVSARAQVRVDDPWVRTTVPEQKTTGAFMALTAAQGGKLVAASSPVATSVEVHEMKMEGDIMRMRAVPSVPLPAGQRVDFKSGGYHLMLLGLKQPVKAGDVVPLTLVVEDAAGKRENVEVRATAKSAP
jgi:copper(I)-binding protein